MAKNIKEVLNELNEKARDERASCTERGNWDGYNHIYKKLEGEALAEIKRIIEEAKPEIARWNMEQSEGAREAARGYNRAIDQYHTNLLKALGE